jgi:hypothetical protein
MIIIPVGAVHEPPIPGRTIGAILFFEIAFLQSRLADNREKGSQGDFVARIGDNYGFISLAEFLVTAALAAEYEPVALKDGDNPLGGI